MFSKIPDYIDSKKIYDKYEITPIIESKELLNDYYRSTLKDFTPDKTTLASDEHRKNTNSQSFLNTRYTGSRAGVEPFTPDLFMGDMTHDNRGADNVPIMGNYKKQLWSRKDDYRKAFKDDSSNTIHSAGITEARVLENKRKAYEGLQSRYKNFDESKNNLSVANNAVFRNKSLVDNSILGFVLDEKNDQNIVKNNVVTNGNNLSKAWESLPDHKIKVADYTKLMKPADISDTNIRKNKDKSETEIKIDKSNEIQSNLNNKLSLLTSNFMNKKRNSVKTSTIKFKSSLKDQTRKINKNKEFLKSKEITNVKLSGKQSNFTEVFDKEYKINKAIHDIRKNVSDFTSDKKNHYKGNNKETMIVSTKKNTSLLTDILRKTIKSNNENFISKGNNKENIINKSRNIDNDELLSKFLQKSVEVNRDVLNKSKGSYEIYNYKAKQPELYNNFNNDKLSIENKLYNHDNEKRLDNVEKQFKYEIKNTNDFETDINYAKSGAVSSAAGTVGNMGTKYMVDKKEYESSILEDDNINDSKSYILR